MGDVKFDEQASYQSRPQAQSGLIRFVIKTGLAKDAASAQNVLLVVVVISVLLSGFFFMSANNADTVKSAPPPNGFPE